MLKFFKKKDSSAPKKTSPRFMVILGLSFVGLLIFSSSRVLSEFPWNGNPIAWLKARDYYDQANLSQNHYSLEMAEKQYKKAISIYKKDWRFHAALGADYFAMGDYSASEAEYKKAIELQPKEYVLWVQLSRMYYLQNNYSEAEKAAIKGAQLNPNDGTPIIAKALALQAQKKKIEANAALQATQMLDKKWPLFWYFSGKYRELDGDKDGAEADYKQASMTDPTNPLYWNALAVMLFDRGDFDNANICLKRACSLDANNPLYWSNLAAVAVKQNDPDKTADYLSKVATLESNNDVAWLNYGLFLYFHQRYKEAEGPLLKGLQLSEQGAKVWSAYFSALENQGKYNVAAEYLTRYLQNKAHAREISGADYVYLAFLRMKGYNYKGAYEALDDTAHFNLTEKEKSIVMDMRKKVDAEKQKNPNPPPPADAAQLADIMRNQGGQKNAPPPAHNTVGKSDESAIKSPESSSTVKPTDGTKTTEGALEQPTEGAKGAPKQTVEGTEAATKQTTKGAPKQTVLEAATTKGAVKQAVEGAVKQAVDGTK